MITARQVASPLLSVVAATTLLLGAQVSMASAGAEETDTGTSLKPGQVVTIAGTGESGNAGDGGDALDARLNGDLNISVGPDGSVYIVDADSRVVRKVDPDGIIDAVPGMGPRSPAEPEPEPGPTSLGSGNAPRASAIGPDGSLYVTSDQGIARIDPAGGITVVAGAGDDTEGVDGARAVDVRIVRSPDIDVDGAGNLYVFDPINARIRKIDGAGILTTVAGGGELSLRESEGLAATGANLVENFGGPESIEVDSRGNVYFMVETNSAVFKVDAAGVLTMVTDTASGFGGDGGPAIKAQLDGARSIAVDDEDNLYIADDNDRIRMVDTDGIITTVGPRLPDVRQIQVGPSGDIFFTSHAQVKMLVRSVDQADVGDPAATEEPDSDSPWADEEPGTVITLVGAEQAPDAEPEPDEESEPAADEEPADSQPALDVVLGPEVGIAVDHRGRLYIADAENERLDVVVDGMLDPFEASGRSLASAGTIATAAAGDTYAVIDGEVVRVYPDGDAVTVAGGGPEGAEVEDGQNALTASFEVSDIATDPDGTLHIADSLHNRLYTLGADGALGVLAELDEFDVASPAGMAVGDDGTVYLADPKGHRVLAVNSAAEATTVAGSGENFAADDDTGDGGSADIGDGGPATEAPVVSPTDVVVDADGTLYVSDLYGIRRVDTDGTITTVVASPAEPAGTTATVHYAPSGLALGPHGDVYFVDTYTSQVRVVVRPAEIADPFPWLWVGLGAGAVVLAAVVVLVIRRRRREARREVPAEEIEQWRNR